MKWASVILSNVSQSSRSCFDLIANVNIDCGDCGVTTTNPWKSFEVVPTGDVKITIYLLPTVGIKFSLGVWLRASWNFPRTFPPPPPSESILVSSNMQTYNPPRGATQTFYIPTNITWSIIKTSIRASSIFDAPDSSRRILNPVIKSSSSSSSQRTRSIHVKP